MARIALATIEDAPLVHRIMQAAFEEYRGTLEPPSSAHDETVEDVRRAFATGGAILAWEGDAARGRDRRCADSAAT